MDEGRGVLGQDYVRFRLALIAELGVGLDKAMALIKTNMHNSINTPLVDTQQLVYLYSKFLTCSRKCGDQVFTPITVANSKWQVATPQFLKTIFLVSLLSETEDYARIGEEISTDDNDPNRGQLQSVAPCFTTTRSYDTCLLLNATIPSRLSFPCLRLQSATYLLRSTLS